MINYYYYYILYSFFIIGIIYCGISIYKAYAKIIFYYINNFFNFKDKTVNIELETINNKNSNTQQKINILKKNYNIRSTENTNYMKFIINKPIYININYNVNNNKDTYYKENFKKILNSSISTKIFNSYIYNKKIFNELFFKNDICLITNLESFYNLYKKIYNENNDIKYNIILKFSIDCNKYLYIYVKKNNLIKIKKYEEYEEIYEVLSYNNEIFLIKDYNNKHYISHGKCIEYKVKKDEIKKIFFNKSSNEDKNYNLLNNYDTVNIIFWTSTIIDI